jgi:hypothetical protein
MESCLHMEFLGQICELSAERITEKGQWWCIQAMCIYEKSTTTIHSQMKGTRAG